MLIRKNVDLKKYSTMKIGGVADFFAEAKSIADLREIKEFADSKNISIFPIGGGSNVIFSDENHSGIFVHIQLRGIIKMYENAEFANIEVAAGEDWDEFVAWTIKNGLSGIESLSAIPGTVGASPIQNIGAYGTEVSDRIISVEVFDLQTGELHEMSNAQCEFGYRDSIFKKNIGKFIITKVVFQLPKKKPGIPQYKDVQIYFGIRKQKNPTAEEIRNAIIEIRAGKLPDINTVPNNGSFFTNPVISKKEAGLIIEKFPNIPFFELDNDQIKFYAGWLIEQAITEDFKNPIVLYEKNKLVLTNPGGKGSFKALQEKIEDIKGAVKEKFDLTLEVEPNII